MTDMTIKEQMLAAVDSGIRKWQNIRSGLLCFDEGQAYCELCCLYYNKKQSEQNTCDDCPLAKAGHSCLYSDDVETGTTWRKYNHLVDLLTLRFEKGELSGDIDILEFSDIEKEHGPTLKELIDQMISHLKEAKAWVVKNVGDEDME